MSQIIPFQFDTISIRAVEIDGEPWFVGKDMADALGYSNSVDALAKHCRGVAKRYPIPDSLGRVQDTRIISEADLWRLIARSQLPEAERIERWIFEEVLPTIRRTGGYSRQAVPASSFVGDGCTIIEAAGRALNLPASEVLGMFQKLACLAGHGNLLPAYAVDSPADQGGSSEPTDSLRSLLLIHRTGLSAIKVYPMLERAGLAEHRSRASSKGGEKRYWCLTESGLAFGKNLTSPANNRETQPHFYVSQFPILWTGQPFVDIRLP